MLREARQSVYDGFLAYRFYHVTTTWLDKAFAEDLVLAEEQVLLKGKPLVEPAWPLELAVVEVDSAYTVDNLISTALAVWR